MVVPGLCIAAPASGTGKTTIATGLIRALARRMEVAPFKVGPDYIDPGYHGLAAGRVGRNLDSVMCGSHRIGPLYAHGSAGCDISVVEGVMGLFDGRIAPGSDPVCAPGSTAEIARALGIPVVLVVDVRGMSQSIGAMVRGFATAVDGVRLAGVILNRAGTGRHDAVCRSACDAVGVPVLGSLPRFADIEVPSRHLGLVTAVEQGGAAVTAVERMADIVEEHLDLDGLVAVADCGWDGEVWNPRAEVAQAGSPTIAVAGGPAFTFAYAEHTELLGAAGARVVRFDPLTDDLPDCDGLIIPGGFPEEHVEDLAGRTGLRQRVRERIADGMPVHGECAGLLWLTATLDAHPMLGVIDTHAAMGRRLTLGYREAVALSDSVLHREGERLTGHEFHHTALTDTTVAGWSPAWGWRGWDGQGVREGFAGGTVHASYLHCHPAATPRAIERFVAACA
ncbi:cobyrinate a,c-diamide synthase [Corynebacterium meridianum]|uniref:Hydrogenobyrinate a,c-diamide synthase n=1 Tax=Corynebacterium meridianum TaxID=2765363 RepID=A0A934M718_9CORY|nr:cobyrinate a,c-diamide synthase [Corynebacterium meridianum]MCK7676778.1 cobyrinate a,c-diamide synthase [Corynebacterium meridianum]